MKRACLLLLISALTACGSSGAVTRSIGSLPPGSRMVVRIARGELDAYKPLTGDPPGRYTLATSSNDGVPSAPSVTRTGKTLSASLTAGANANEFLVRVPGGVSLDASSGDGDVNVTDITGVATAHADNGNVKVMVEGYARASANNGNVTVYMGSTDWPGTLHFSSDRGDVEVWINATANFHVTMHTDRGTIFTDFPLRGTSSGLSETIVGNVGDSNAHSIDILAHNGSIRLLQLKPQI
jgi:hypothetical protein